MDVWLKKSLGAQQYDQFGKIFTVKLLYIFYKEKAGFRPGQVTKAERLTNKLSQFAAYAIQGDYQGVKEFGSDLKKLGLPVEHGAQVWTLPDNFHSEAANNLFYLFLDYNSFEVR